MSGIFGEVYILNRPENHLQNFNITTAIIGNKGIINFFADKSCDVSLYDRTIVLCEYTHAIGNSLG